MIRGLMLCGLLLCLGTTALALEDQTLPGTMTVEDKDAFSEEGKTKAEELFQETEFKAPTEFTVVVFDRFPDRIRGEYERVKDDKAARQKLLGTWAREEAKLHDATGVFLLISLEKGGVRAINDRQTDVDRNFTDTNLDELELIISTGFGAAAKLKDNAKIEKRDETLLKATQYVIDKLKDTTVPAGKNRVTSNRSEDVGGGRSIMGWVCIGICILVVVWVIIGLIRAMSGAGGGYGGGGMGGGGFFPSLMGGMFGAMAGMYLYDQFTGHDSASDNMSDDGGMDDGGYADDGAGDFDRGGDGGGDFGGGDWGGGGDDFGGGDFGGGDW